MLAKWEALAAVGDCNAGNSAHPLICLQHTGARVG